MAHFESKGLPSVGILTTGFAPQAAYQAKSLGCEDAVSLFVKHPISDATPEEMISKADSVYENMVKGLKDVTPPRQVVETADVDTAECGT